MKKCMLFSAMMSAALTLVVEAGGDIEPALTPVEPIAVQKTAIPVYLGAGFSVGRYFTDDDEDVTYGAMVRAGYDVNQYIGFEARYIATFWDEGRTFGQRLEHIGLFVKPMLPFNENFNLYGLLGYGWTQTKTDGYFKTLEENGFSAGFGLEYDLSDKRYDYDPTIYYPEGFDGQGDQEMGWGLFVDFQRLLVDSDMPDLDVISAGVTYDF